MITEEHLKHWIKEIEWFIGGLQKEISSSKVAVGGISDDGNCVSFEYLREKIDGIQKILGCIEYDMKDDKA